MFNSLVKQKEAVADNEEVFEENQKGYVRSWKRIKESSEEELSAKKGSGKIRFNQYHST